MWRRLTHLLNCNDLTSNIVDCVLSGLLTVMSGADRVPAGIQPAAGSATQQLNRNQTCGWGSGPVLYADRCKRHQHLRRLTATSLITWWTRESCDQKAFMAGSGRGCLIWTQHPLLFPSASFWTTIWPICHSHTHCPLWLPRQDRVPRPPCNIAQVTFSASVPSPLGKRTEHYRNVPERKDD